MPFISTYLLSRNGIWYFNYRIPQIVRAEFNRFCPIEEGWGCICRNLMEHLSYCFTIRTRPLPASCNFYSLD